MLTNSQLHLPHKTKTRAQQLLRWAMGWKVGGAVPLFGRGAGSPSNTMSFGPRPTSEPSGKWIHPALWPKIGGCAHFEGRGAGSLFNTMWPGPVGRGLPPYQVASWSIQPFGHNRHGPKSAGAAVPPFLRGGELGRHLTQCRLDRGLPLYQVAS